LEDFPDFAGDENSVLGYPIDSAMASGSGEIGSGDAFTGGADFGLEGLTGLLIAAGALSLMDGLSGAETGTESFTGLASCLTS